MKNKETLEEAAKNYVDYCSCNISENEDLADAVEKANYIAGFKESAKWQQEKICNSEVLQRIRASKSDAEARRIIKTI